MIKSNFDYSGKIFKNISLKSAAKTIKSSEFNKCKFIDCDFSEGTFNKTSFDRCDFNNCDLGLIKLDQCQLITCKFKDSRMIGIDFANVRDELGCEIIAVNCNLSFCVFSQINISNSEFIECKITNATFEKCTMRETKFSDSDLAKTRILQCDLSKADFSNSKNIAFDPSKNTCKKTVFDRYHVDGILSEFGIEIQDEYNQPQS